MTKRVFISYSHMDTALLERLHKHLAQLLRENSIEGWYDRDINAGGHLDDEIGSELARTEIFIACVSPVYIGSRYCYDRELAVALEREQRRELAIVPIIFEPCDWLSTPLAKFKAVPSDGKPVTEFTNQNLAFMQVVNELRKIVNDTTSTENISSPAAATARDLPNSRYRVRREFDALAKRDFIESAFSEIYKFFEASVAEVSGLADLEARLSSHQDNHFSCTVINRGISRGFETLHVRSGGEWSPIEILYGENNSVGSSNGGFTIEADGYQLYLKPHIFNIKHEDKTMSARDAAQMLWDDLLSKVGVDYA